MKSAPFRTRALPALLGALLVCLPAAAAVRFVAFGDAGRGNAAQYRNGDAIAALCALKGCDFALYLGDNFYGKGINSVDDPQFQTKFEQPYARVDLPFYAVLGNHDYGDPPLDIWKPAFQIAYTHRSAKWRMPDYFYKFSRENADFFALDTQGIVSGLSDGKQRGWLAAALAASSAQWKIVFGHHPYISNGPHGNAGNYEGCGGKCPEEISGARLKRLVDGVVCGAAHVYFSGHDHNLQWPMPACGTEFIVSGAGSSTEPFRHRDNNPTRFESDAHIGFMWVEIDGTRFTGEFYDQGGVLLYARSITAQAGPQRSTSASAGFSP